MEEWLKDHWSYGLLIICAAVWKYGGWLKKVVGKLLGYQQTYIQVQEQLTDGYKAIDTLTTRERDRARAECEQLRTEIRRVLLEKDIRDDAGRQDRAMVRKLKLRMMEFKVDFSDIEEDNFREFNGTRTSSDRHKRDVDA